MPPSSYSCGGRAESHSILLFGLKRHPQLEQFDDDIAKLLEKDLVVPGVSIHMLPEILVLDEHHIRGQHHQGLGLDVFELLGASPLVE